MSENRGDSAAQGSSKGKGSLLFALVVMVLLVVLGYEAYLYFSRSAPTEVARPAEAGVAVKQGADQTVTTFGDESAPIKIQFYAPLVLDWHKKTIGLLRDYDQKHPGRIFVTLMPMGNAECDTEMKGKGHDCATILVNGTNEFTLADSRKVTLTKRPNTSDSFYNSEDVITVIEQLTENRDKD